MPRKSPCIITLSTGERERLEAMARKYTSSYRDVIRAKIALYAAAGLGNDEIAARLDTPPQIVSKWRSGSLRNAFAAWRSDPVAGARPAFPPSVVVAIKALACELPHENGLPVHPDKSY